MSLIKDALMQQRNWRAIYYFQEGLCLHFHGFGGAAERRDHCINDHSSPSSQYF